MLFGTFDWYYLIFHLNNDSKCNDGEYLNMSGMEMFFVK